MADNEIAEVILEMHAKYQALELILIDLIFSTWPLEVHRNERRESTCRALEERIAMLNPSGHEHLHLLHVLATIENLYGTPGPPIAAPE